MHTITQRAVLFLFLSIAGFSQEAALNLASASGAPGSSILLNLTLTSSQDSIASAQWTLNYWPVDVAAVNVVAGSGGDILREIPLLCRRRRDAQLHPCRADQRRSRRWRGGARNGATGAWDV